MLDTRQREAQSWPPDFMWGTPRREPGCGMEAAEAAGGKKRQEVPLSRSYLRAQGLQYSPLAPPVPKASSVCLPEFQALGPQLNTAATAKHNISLNSPFHLEYSCDFCSRPHDMPGLVFECE